MQLVVVVFAVRLPLLWSWTTVMQMGVDVAQSFATGVTRSGIWLHADSAEATPATRAMMRMRCIALTGKKLAGICVVVEAQRLAS